MEGDFQFSLAHVVINGDGFEPVSISAIVPVYNSSAFIRQSLPPLLAMHARGEALEIIVVDDSSTDESAEIASALGAKVVPSGGRLGPGAARNVAAQLARGDVLWFVDSDVVVHEDAARQLQAAFAKPTVVAVFGSYDDHPPVRNFFSQYKNLVHHYYHHIAAQEASTFWAGCGAVRKKAFLQVGGFDTMRYTRPSIEDIELGYRLRAKGGRILLLRKLQGTHLKEWRLRDLIQTEIFHRAVPWSRLILQTRDLINDLNVGTHERLRALLAGTLFLSVGLFLFSIIAWWWPVLLVVACVIANHQLTMLFYRRNGALFALGGMLFHQVYYLYSSAAFGWCWFEHRLALQNHGSREG
ncbi:MAG: glycosyltransferase [Gammaproteobacteria bacterium]|nr:glycosyltransferase [Gammaproteobacteria bacterium]